MSNIVPMQTVQPLRPRDYSGQQLGLIRRTVAADTTVDEFDMFMEVCRRVGLDPFRKQIYCNVYNKDKPNKRKVVFVTGIDGFRGVAARNRDYRPDEEEPQYTIEESAKNDATNPLGIVKAVVYAYKLGPDGWHRVAGTAYWDEFAPITEKWAEIDGKWQPTGKFELDRKGNWFRMSRHMIAKCAEAQALRKGWPEDLSGIYAPEELDGMAVAESASAAVEQHEKEQRLLRIGAKDTVPIQWSAGEPIEAVPVGKLADKVSEFIGKSESPTQIEAWENLNQLGLREFWALHKSDALELKKTIEARKKALSDECA